LSQLFTERASQFSLNLKRNTTKLRPDNYIDYSHQLSVAFSFTIVGLNKK